MPQPLCNSTPQEACIPVVKIKCYLLITHVIMYIHLLCGFLTHIYEFRLETTIHFDVQELKVVLVSTLRWLSELKIHMRRVGVGWHGTWHLRSTPSFLTKQVMVNTASKVVIIVALIVVFTPCWTLFKFNNKMLSQNEQLNQIQGTLKLGTSVSVKEHLEQLLTRWP